jgi:hypothetical protein
LIQEVVVILLVVLAVLALVVFGVAFTVHWLFLIAVVLAAVWLVSFLMGGRHGRSRSVWR